MFLPITNKKGNEDYLHALVCQTKPALLVGWLLLEPKEYRQYNQDTELP